MAQGEGGDVFNPQVQPTQDPNFAFWARPAQRQQPNISGETLFKGLGSAFDEGVRGADDFVKRGIIQPQVEQEAGEVRDQFVNSLTTAQAKIPLNTDAKPSLSDAETPDKTNIPGVVSRVGQQAQTLQGALDSGHISETYYYGQLNSLAKSLRAQYPGYRDYIDQELGRVTGVHPANQYIRSMIGDMNRQQTERKTEAEKTEAFIREGIREHVPNMDAMSDAFRAGKVTASQVEQYYTQQTAWKWNAEKAKAEHEQSTYTREDDNRFQTDQAGSFASNIVNNAVNLPLTLNGHTPGSFLELAQRQAGGKDQFSDEDWTGLAQSQLTLKNTLDGQLRKYLDSDSGNGLSFGARMGLDGTKKEEWIKSQLQPIENNIQAATNKDLGYIAGNAAMTKAMLADEEHKLVSKPDNFKMIAALDTIKKYGGENAMPLISDQLNKNGVLGRIAGWLDTKQVGAMAQPDSSKGVWNTLFGDTQDGKTKHVDDERGYAGLLTNVQHLNDPKVSIQTKVNLAHYYYDPQNSGLMPMYKEDTVDAKGNVVQGKYKAYTMLFNDSTSKAMHKLSKDSGDPNIWSNYESSAKENAFTLFGDKLATLQDIQSDPLMTNAHFKYDSERGLTMIDTDGKPMKGSVQARDAVAKVNLMLNSLRSVEKAAGGDTDAFLLDSIQKLGVDPSKMEGIPARIAQAIANSRGPKTPTESEALGSAYDPYNTKDKNKQQDRVQPGGFRNFP